MTPRPGSEQPETNPNSQPASDTPPTPGNPAVERIIERFGGIRPMAHKLRDTPVTTVQGWKKRGAIPLSRHADLRAAADKHKISLDETDLEAATPVEDRLSVEDKPIKTDTIEAPVSSADAPTAPPQTPMPALDVPATEPHAIEPKPASIASESPSAEPPNGERPSVESSSVERTGPAYTPPPPAKPQSGGGFATAVSLLALLVGGAALSEPWWQPSAPDWWPKKPQVAAAAPQVAPALRDQMQQVSERLTKLEQRPAASTGASSADMQTLAGRIDALEKRPTPTPLAAAPTAAAVDSTALKSLTERIDALEKRPAPASGATAPATAAVDSVALKSLAERLDTLEKRPTPASTAAASAVDPAAIKTLTERLNTLENQPPPPPPAPSVDPAEVTSLTNRLVALEGKTGPDPQTIQDLTALKQQVSTLKQQTDIKQDSAIKAQALVLATGQLRGVLAGSGPFPSELQAAKAVGGDDPQIAQALDAVAPYAAKGIPTQVQLADRLQREGTGIVRAALKGEGGSWVQQVTGTLATLVIVRRQGGDVVGDTPEAIVARSQAAMDKGNLEEAVGEMSKLQGPSAQTAAGWLADAKARLTANAAGQQLTNRSITALTGASGGKVSP